MSGHLDEEYLTWLYGQMGIVKLKNPARTHWGLARQLYKKEFVWFIPNDDNRVEDGRDLRTEFVDEFDLDDAIDENWMRLGCSMLEMLVALSRRLAFMTDIDPREWFWEMLENVGIGMSYSCDQKYNDEVADEVNEILDTIIWRTYGPNGDGGLFPLNNPDRDQRQVEIWYQLSAYLSPDV